MKEAAVPSFSSEAEEAAWWDAHRSEIEAEIRRRIKQKRPLSLNHLIRAAKSSRPITLRIATEDLETARRLAARQGLGYQTYIKMLLRTALAKSAAADETSRGDVRSGKPAVEFDGHRTLKHTKVAFTTRDGRKRLARGRKSSPPS